jgi:hypothetical protein
LYDLHLHCHSSLHLSVINIPLSFLFSTRCLRLFVGYCNPFYGIDSGTYFSPTSSSYTWYPLYNGYAYSETTPTSDEGWTATSNCGATGSLTTFTFICNTSATSVALTQSSARLFADPSQCAYIVQLQTSLACSNPSNFLPAPTSQPQFGGMGYDLSSLTGYDIMAAQSGTYNGLFAEFSFCLNIYSGTSPTTLLWSATGIMEGTYTTSSGTISSLPAGTFTINSLVSSVITSLTNSPAPQSFQLSPLGDDGSDNVITLVAGTTTVLTSAGGTTIQWLTSTGTTQYANIYLSNGINIVDNAASDTPWSTGWASGNPPTVTITMQYYSSTSPNMITCPNVQATPITNTALNLGALPV